MSSLMTFPWNVAVMDFSNWNAAEWQDESKKDAYRIPKIYYHVISIKVTT